MPQFKSAYLPTVLFSHCTLLSIHEEYWVSGREQELKFAYCMMHPFIMSGKHPLTTLMIQTEHLRLLHAGPTLLMSSLSRRYHIVGGKRVFHSITRACVTCWRASQKPKLKWFIARRGKPSLVWSDHGSNFVGAQKDLKELIDFLEDQKNQNAISQFCTSQRIVWKFIPELSPHFRIGGLWESCVKSLKFHLKRILSRVKLTFEEYTTVLMQVEACLNSRPLSCDDDGCDALTPGHFLIGRSLEALPDPAFSYRAVSLLRRWHLCQNLVRHIWQRWSADYLSSLRKYAKWHQTSPNLSVGDIVVINEDGMVPTTWLMGHIVEVFPGRDGLVRVVDVKTKNGVYKWPIHKLALLLPNECWKLLNNWKVNCVNLTLNIDNKILL
jgi:hypothetical protein